MLQTCQQSAYTTISSLRLMELFSEGGILAFVTSRGVTDAPGNKFVRDYLVNHANLIMALRLPDNLFMQTSGIEVGSELLIFRRIHTSRLYPTAKGCLPRRCRKWSIRKGQRPNTLTTRWLN